MSSTPPPRQGGIRPGAMIIATALAIALCGVLLILLRRDAPTPPPAGAATEAAPAPATDSPPTPASPRHAAAATRPATPPADTTEAGSQTSPPAAAEPTADPNVVSPDNFSRPGYHERLRNHISVVASLRSPARTTEEFRGIATLCQRFGYEPATVATAYNLAYEYNRTLRMRTDADATPAQIEEARELTMSMFRSQVADAFSRAGAPVDPAFTEALLDYKPTVFFGQMNGLSGRENEPLLDRIEWADWLSRVEAPPAKP